MKKLSILIVLKFVVMEEDFNLTAMMEIRKMEMDVIKIVKSKKDGIAKALPHKNQVYV